MRSEIGAIGYEGRVLHSCALADMRFGGGGRVDRPLDLSTGRQLFN
jgi:hypothetical protein